MMIEFFKSEDLNDALERIYLKIRAEGFVTIKDLYEIVHEKMINNGSFINYEYDEYDRYGWYRLMDIKNNILANPTYGKSYVLIMPEPNIHIVGVLDLE